VRTRNAAALVTAGLVVVGVAGGYAVTRHTGPSRPLVASTAPPTAAARPSVLPTLAATAPPPTAAGVTAALATTSLSARLGPQLDGAVVDVSTGTPLYTVGDMTPVPPASTTKLLTAAAALTALGPDSRLTTSTERVSDTVYLVGGGDVTITRQPDRSTYPQPASLADLARRTAAALGSGSSVRLRLDASGWTGPQQAVGWSKGYVREGDVAPPAALEVDEGRVAGGLAETTARVTDPVGQAGAQFAALLRGDGVRVEGAVRAATAPAAATRLAAVQSPTVAALVQRMLTASDNDLAEALGREVARHDHRAPSFAGAAAAVTVRAAALGVPRGVLDLHDTSGLSREDRVTPTALVDVLRAAAAADHPQLRAIVEGLPVAGVTGTLAGRYRSGSAAGAAGVVRAKTGTLAGLSALAGLVVDASGRLLAFAFVAPQAPPPGVTEPALDRLAARLGRCGCAGPA
jgi:D-alanyl-D-alanine carboxypeptidase/D-alanyl-D-alanine-endopeptidase (penicillin-binding protein 4)